MPKLFELTEDGGGEVTVDSITFDPIPVADSDEQTVYVQNTSNGELTIESVSVSNETGSGTVDVVDAPETIAAGDSGAMLLRAESVAADTLNGISADIEIKASAIVYPD
jgi:hypothetical protein